MTNNYTVRALDVNGDWAGGRGKSDYLYGTAAIAQNVKTRLQSILADCFFKLNDGIDWFGYLGTRDILGFEQQIRNTILNTDGVTELTDFELTLNPKTRALNLYYEADTVYTGVAQVSATIASDTTYLLTEGGLVITTEDGNPLSY